jgi:hypothetical protein
MSFALRRHCSVRLVLGALQGRYVLVRYRQPSLAVTCAPHSVQALCSSFR